MPSKRPVIISEIPEDIEFDSDSDSLFTCNSRDLLDHQDQLTLPENDLQSKAYQGWMIALLTDLKFAEYFDVDFLLKGSVGSPVTVLAHRLILSTRNSYFAKLFKEERYREVVLIEPDIPPEIFQAVITYIYTGDIQIPKLILRAVSLLFAAKKYQVELLYDLCKEFILARVPRGQAKQIILLCQRAIDLELDDLKPSLTRFLKERTSEVVRDPQFMLVKDSFLSHLLELDVFTGIGEREVLEMALRWGHRQVEEKAGASQEASLRSVLEPFIHKFRLNSIPRDHLANIITESGVFSEKEQLRISLYLLGHKRDMGDFTIRKRQINQKEYLSINPMEAYAASQEQLLLPPLSSYHTSEGSRRSRSTNETPDYYAIVQHRKPKNFRDMEISRPIGQPEHRFSVHADMNYYVNNMTQNDQVIRNIVANLPTPVYPATSNASVEVVPRNGPPAFSKVAQSSRWSEADLMSQAFTRNINQGHKSRPLPTTPAPPKPPRAHSVSSRHKDEIIEKGEWRMKGPRKSLPALETERKDGQRFSAL